MLEPTVSLPPGYKGDGVTALLESEELQTKFSNDAVKLAVEKGYPSYNMDIENSGGHTCEDFALFLGKMADAMHTVSKNLSVDYDGGFLSEDCQAKSSVDRLGDMNTYGAFGIDLFLRALQKVMLTMPSSTTDIVLSVSGKMLRKQRKSDLFGQSMSQ